MWWHDAPYKNCSFQIVTFRTLPGCRFSPPDPRTWKSVFILTKKIEVLLMKSHMYLHKIEGPSSISAGVH